MNNGGIHLVVRRFWRAETGFYIGIWLFFTVMGRSRLFRDPGTFWHTVAGRRILDRPALPTPMPSALPSRVRRGFLTSGSGNA